MEKPVIPTLPAFPVRGEDRETFATKANAHVAALPAWATQVDAMGTFVDERATIAESSATTASSASTAAVAAANFKGAWSGLTGALNIPASVSHSGTTWLLLVDLVDVTTSEPGVSVDWQKAVSFTNVEFDGSITEEVYALAGTELNPVNGTIQTKTIAAATTFTDALASGQSMVLMLTGAGSHTITWPTTTWTGGAAPTLTAADVIVFWKVATTLYSAYVGSTA